MAHNVILKAPTHIELMITEKCNHKCRHCYNAWRGSDPRKGIISSGQREYILQELIKNQVTYVTLTGGEPLLDQETLFWFIEKFRENNIGIGLNTNLSLMNDKIADRLVSEYNWENTILTSLPGFTDKECDYVTQVTGSFRNIERGIEICCGHGIDVGVNVVVTKSNTDKLTDLYGFLDRHDISVLALTRVVPPVYNSNEGSFLLDRVDINKIVGFLKAAKDRYGIRVTSLCSLPFCLVDDAEAVNLFSTKCAAGIIGCCINAISGAITPCAHNEESYGNIYIDGLSEAWKKMSAWRNGKFTPKECQSCSMLNACGGDCRLNTIRIKKRPYSLDGSCNINLISSQTDELYNRVAKYSFNRKTILREESFGAVVSIGVNEFYVTMPVYKLLCILRNWGTFCHKDLEGVIIVNATLEKLLNQWIGADIIYRIDQ